MAGDVGYRRGGLARRFQEQAQAQYRLLVLPSEQRLMDCVGIKDHALALIGLQLCLAALNIRGAFKSEDSGK